MTGPLLGKTVMVTGANTGIGRSTAIELAARGANVVLASRSRSRTEPVIAEIRTAGGSVEFLPLELASLEAVRMAAMQFLDCGEALDVLVNNAGLGRRGVTADGFELAFGVNHLGHYLLTRLLLPALERAGGGRIVVVASNAHYGAGVIDWEALEAPTRSWTGLEEYQTSKLANVLFAAELADRMGPHGTVCSLHPGVVATDIWRRLPQPARWLVTRRMLSPEQGAATSIYCASSPTIESGAYYDDCRIAEPSAVAQDRVLAGELWRRSEEWVAPHLDGRSTH